MTFVSYAQNFEDVILWRALSQYGPGFYIDVGACDPIAESVTKAFYDAGWRGINIEPIREAFERVSVARPRDINLNLAIDSKNGIHIFYSVDDGNGLSTSIKKYAEQYISEGRKVEAIEVETKTLADICKSFIDQEIHFLKIDVEGSELSVLQGADFKSYRPWVIVVESVILGKYTEFWLWDQVLISADYRFVYFDGLNRFYIANEKLDLLAKHFTAPPNYFDNFEKWDKVELNEKVKTLMETIDTIISLNFPPFVSKDNIINMINELISNHSYLAGKLAETEQALGNNSALITELAGRNNEVTAEIERLVTECTRLQNLNTRVNIELDACYQELFEDSRYIGFLSKERSNANVTLQSNQSQIAQRDVMISSLQSQTMQKDEMVSSLQSQISSLLLSTSWRITSPMRSISRFIRRFVT